MCTLMENREKFRKMGVEKMAEVMNGADSIKHNNVMNIYSLNLETYCVEKCTKKTSGNVARFTFIDYDEDTEKTPYIVLSVPITKLKYIPIEFGEQPNETYEFNPRHVGCIIFDHDECKMNIFNPDGHLSYFDSVIDNSSIICKYDSDTMCRYLLGIHADALKFRSFQCEKINVNFKNSDYEILDGRNCVLLTILYKYYDLYGMTPGEISKLLTHIYMSHADKFDKQL